MTPKQTLKQIFSFAKRTAIKKTTINKMNRYFSQQEKCFVLLMHQDFKKISGLK